MKLIIFAEKLSYRLQYVTNFLFNDCVKLPFEIITDSELFKSYTGPKINYSNQTLSASLSISPSNLLFETGIKEQNIAVGTWETLPVIFHSGNSELPFDFFAASFFLISRYEEYLPHIRDKYDRFESENSIAVHQGFLARPIIDLWLKNVLQKISYSHPEFNWVNKKFRYISTIDIDNAYAFKQKGVMRTIGGYARALVNMYWEDIRERTLVLFGKMKDPYDTYSMQIELQKKYQLEVIYFILLGDYGENDKNLPSNNIRFQKLIKHLNDYAEVGIHPSFGSNGNPDQVKKEIARLNRIIHKEISKSRQHFLKLHFPETYKTLIENGITDDYTMGYASQIGFRAGTCSSFNWYDLDSELETNLRVHPFAVMDATFRFYLNSSPEQVVQLAKPLMDDVKSVNGTFISIWHNETISNWRKWNGWQNAYEDIIKLAQS